MADHRLLFSKTGRARYISHLDLMRTFQRAFFRAQIPIKHTEGFNPHAFISIALPLSVGYSSDCEILEFGLLDGVDEHEVPARLNAALPEGITVLDCYAAEQPIKALTHLEWQIEFLYDGDVPAGAGEALRELLSRESLVVEKKSKKSKTGSVQTDVIPLIRRWSAEEGEDAVVLHAVLAAQNPGLNPELIRAAFCREYESFAPDYVSFHRARALDGEERTFR